MSDIFQFPGVPDDDPLGDIDIPSPLTPRVSTYSSATVAVENGEVNAFTVHSNRMRSTRALTDLGPRRSRCAHPGSTGSRLRSNQLPKSTRCPTAFCHLRLPANRGRLGHYCGA